MDITVKRTSLGNEWSLEDLLMAGRFLQREQAYSIRYHRPPN